MPTMDARLDISKNFLIIASLIFDISNELDKKSPTDFCFFKVVTEKQSRPPQKKKNMEGGTFHFWGAVVVGAKILQHQKHFPRGGGDGGGIYSGSGGGGGCKTLY